MREQSRAITMRETSDGTPTFKVGSTWGSALNALLLAGVIPLSLITGEPPAYTPPRCYTVTTMERVEPKAIKEDSTRLLRSIAGDVIVQKSSSGARGQTFANRVADKVRGSNDARAYHEVQRTVCDADYVQPETHNEETEE